MEELPAVNIAPSPVVLILQPGRNCFDCWEKCVCVRVCGRTGESSQDQRLSRMDLIHFLAVIGRKFQITKEHIGLIQFALNSANDFPSPPDSPGLPLCHTPRFSSSHGLLSAPPHRVLRHYSPASFTTDRGL